MGKPLVPKQQSVYVTPAPIRYFNIYHNFPITNPLPVQTPGTLRIMARDRYGNRTTGSSQNGQYYTGMVKFGHSGSTNTVFLAAMPGSATYYKFVESDEGYYANLQVLDQTQEFLKVRTTHYAVTTVQAIDYPVNGYVYGYTDDTDSPEKTRSSGDLVTAGITVTPVTDPTMLLAGTNYENRTKIYQGDGNTNDNFQPFNLVALKLVILPTELPMVAQLSQIRLDRVGNFDAKDVTNVSLYYDSNKNYRFDPEVTKGGTPADTRITDATYDSGTDAWYLQDLSIKKPVECQVTTFEKEFFIAVRISTTAVSGRDFGMRLLSYQYVLSSGNVTTAANNFEIRTSTWYVERAPSKIYTLVENIAAYYQADDSTFTASYPYFCQGTSDAQIPGMLKIGFWTNEFMGNIRGIRVNRTGNGYDKDLVGCKIYMDGTDNDKNGKIDSGSPADGIFQSGGDMALTDWISFVPGTGTATGMFSHPQLIDTTTRYFFIAYNVGNSATPLLTHGAVIKNGSIISSEGEPAPFVERESTKVVVYATADEADLTGVNVSGPNNFVVPDVLIQGDNEKPVIKLTMATLKRTALWQGIKLDRVISRDAATGVPTGILNKPQDVREIKVWYDANGNGIFDGLSGGDQQVNYADPAFVTQMPDQDDLAHPTFPYDTLAVNVSSISTDVRVNDINAFIPQFNRFPDAPGRLMLDDGTDNLEIVTYTGVDKSSKTFTGLIRGQDGTNAIAHSTGAIVSGSAIIALMGYLGGQELTTPGKNYFITLNVAPLSTIGAINLGVEMPSTSYFAITTPDFMKNNSGKVGLKPNRGSGSSESSISKITEYSDKVNVAGESVVGGDYVQNSRNVPVYSFKIKTDKSNAYWSGIIVYATGTATIGGQVTNDVSKVCVWYDANNNGGFDLNGADPYGSTDTRFDILIASAEFNNTGGQPLSSKITFPSARIQRVITKAQADKFKISQRYFIAYDIRPDAQPVDDNNQPRTLGCYFTIQSFPAGAGQPISDPNTLDTTGFPFFSDTKKIVASPRTVFVKATPVFADENARTGISLTYNVPRLNDGINDTVNELSLYSDDKPADLYEGPLTGFPESGYVMVENEMISYSSRTFAGGWKLTGLQRGILGSTMASHSSGTLVGLQVIQGALNQSVMKLEMRVDGFKVELGSVTLKRITPYLLNGSDKDISAIKMYRDDNANGRLDRFTESPDPAYKGLVTVADTIVNSYPIAIFGAGGAAEQATIALNDPVINKGYVLIETTPKTFFITFDVDPAASFSHPGIANLNQVSGMKIVGPPTSASDIFVHQPSAGLSHIIATYVPVGMPPYPAAFPAIGAYYPIRATMDTLLVTPGNKALSTADQGANNVPMIGMTIKADKNTVKWQSMKLNLTGTGVDGNVLHVKVWRQLNTQSEYSQYNVTATIQGLDYGLITQGTERFIDRVAVISLVYEQVVGTFDNYYLMTYDIDPFTPIGKTLGAKIADISYFGVGVPDLVAFYQYVQPSFNSDLTMITEVKSYVSVTMQDSAGIVQRDQGGSFQGEQRVPILRFKMATNKANAYWDGLQVMRTGSSNDASKPYGRNTDVKYVKVYQDLNVNGILDANDPCISDVSAEITGFLPKITDAMRTTLEPGDSPPFYIIVKSTIDATNAVFPGSGQQLWVQIKDEVMAYDIAGTTYTVNVGTSAFIRITERSKFASPKVQYKVGDTIKKVDMFKINDDLDRLKTIVFTKSQLLSPNEQTYFFSYDIGDNAIAGNALGVEITDKAWFIVRSPKEFSPVMNLEPIDGSPPFTSDFTKCKSTRFLIGPIKLSVRMDTLAPISAKQTEENVPLMRLRMWVDRNSYTIKQITFTQIGTVESTTTAQTPYGTGQGDFSRISVWMDAPDPITGTYDGLFNSSKDILIGYVSRSAGGKYYTLPKEWIDFSTGIVVTPLTAQSQPVTLFVAVNVGVNDLANLSTEGHLAGVKIENFNNISAVPQTSVSDVSNTFPYVSPTFTILDKDAIIPPPISPIPIVWKDPFGDGYPAVDTNNDGSPDRQYVRGEVFIDLDGDGVNDLKDYDGDGIKAELDLDGDGLMDIDLDGDGKLDVDLNYDGLKDRIVPDTNGDGLPEIVLNDNKIMKYASRWTNSRIKLYSRWTYMPSVKSYLTALGNGPDNENVSRQWFEMKENYYSMSGLSLDENAATKTVDKRIAETDMPTIDTLLKIYVESLPSGFNTQGNGYIYVGSNEEPEIMYYETAGSESKMVGTTETRVYFFNVYQRKMFGTNARTYEIGTPVYNHIYYYKLKAKSQSNVEGPSVMASIYRVDVGAPSAPVNVIGEGASVSAGSDKYSIKVQWDKANDNDFGSGVRIYQLEESRDTDPRWKKVDVVSSRWLTLSIERTGGNYYYYRVRVQDAAGNWGLWSNTAKVTVSIPAEVLTNVSNYPNPVNLRTGQTETYVTYTMNQDADVTITLYDLLGYKVYEWNCPRGEMWSGTGKKFIDGKGKGGAAGVNVVIWNIRNEAGDLVSKGGYIAHIKVKSSKGEVTTMRKIGVIK
jgi:hypothetical protein